jgi:hypothetical protein
MKLLSFMIGLVVDEHQCMEGMAECTQGLFSKAFLLEGVLRWKLVLEVYNGSESLLVQNQVQVQNMTWVCPCLLNRFSRLPHRMEHIIELVREENQLVFFSSPRISGQQTEKICTANLLFCKKKVKKAWKRLEKSLKFEGGVGIWIW